MILRGVAHVHSHYSWDGHHPLPEIAGFLRARGLDFVLMSEHTKRLEPTAFGEFVATCDALTDERLRGVPGREFEATPEHVHVLGYGLRALSTARDAAAIGRFVRESGGLAVLAHPTWKAAHTHVDAPALARLEGWEVWNGKADGRWSPSADGVARLDAARGRRAGLVALGGLDMHNLEAYAGITLEVDAPARTGPAILDALRRGAFTVVGERLRFGANDRPAVAGSATAAGEVLRRVKRWAERLDRKMGRAGLQAPASVYRLARRFLR